MKTFICDSCKKQFNQALDEETYKDVNGNWHTFDLCAPCRGTLTKNVEEPKYNFFKKLIKKDK